MPVILQLRRPRRKDRCKFQASLDYMGVGGQRSSQSKTKRFLSMVLSDVPLAQDT